MVGNLKTALQASVTNLETHKVAQPLDGNNRPTNGTSGQSLRTKGDGTTEWADVGLPTDAQTAQAVSDWLDAHPEATTTVQDGSLTEAKFSNALKLKAIKEYVTPEMFGAVGDGVADDTEAFQRAVDSSSKLLVCGLYNVSTILINKKIKMFGPGTLSSNTTPIHINNHEKGGSFDGLTFIGKDTSVYVEYARSPKFINCEFLNASNYGIKIDAGNGVVLSCCRIKGSSEGSTGHGIHITTSDCEFSNIVIQDFKTAVYNRGYNVFNTIHGWIWATSLFEGSTFMDTKGVQSLFCYADSFQYGYKLTGSNAVNLIGTEFYWNTTEVYPKDLKPYLIFIQDGFSDNDRIFIAGLGVDVSRGMVNPSFCNTKLKLKFDFYGLNKMYTANIDDLPEKTFTITPGEYPVVVNNNYVSGRCVNINYAVDLRNVDDSITTDSILIGTIPEPYRPIGEIVSRAFTTDNIYSPSGNNEGNCYVFFSKSGSIKVRLGTIRKTRQFCIISMSFVF